MTYCLTTSDNDNSNNNNYKNCNNNSNKSNDSNNETMTLETLNHRQQIVIMNYVGSMIKRYRHVFPKKINKIM